MDFSRDSRTRLILLCLLVIVLVWIIGYGFDRLLVRDGVPRFDILLTSNALTGIVAGFLFFSLTNNERLRRNVISQRLRTISEMNHHIRNSLQVITYATATQRNSESMDMIRSSVERIEWALREVLPNEIDGPVAAPQNQEHPESLHTH